MKKALALYGFLMLFAFNARAVPVIVQGYITSVADSVSMTPFLDISDFLIDKRALAKHKDFTKRSFFRFSYEAARGMEYTLNIGPLTIFKNLFLMPGDTLGIEYKDTLIINDKMAVRFTGNAAGAAIFHKRMESNLYGYAEDAAFDGLAFARFKSYVSARMQSLLSGLDSQAKVYHISKEFVDHERKYIVYGSAEVVLYYSRMSSYQFTKQYNVRSDSTIWDYMLPYKLENKDALEVSSYYDYLYCYLTWFAEYKMEKTPAAQRGQFLETHEFLILVDKMLHGLFRDVAYARLLKTYQHQQPWDPADRDKTTLQMIDGLLAKIKPGKDNALNTVYQHDLNARNSLCRKYNDADPAVYDDDNAPALSLPDETGRAISIKDIHGKYILMHFWTSDTGTDARENQEAQIIQQDMENNNLVVLNICIGTDSTKWKAMLSEHNFGGMQLYDKDSTSRRNYGGPKTPYYILIGKSGKILEYFYSQSLEAIKPFIIDYLKEP